VFIVALWAAVFAYTMPTHAQLDLTDPATSTETLSSLPPVKISTPVPIPVTTSTFPFAYTTITSHSINAVNIKYGDMEKASSYTCSLVTTLCKILTAQQVAANADTQLQGVTTPISDLYISPEVDPTTQRSIYAVARIRTVDAIGTHLTNYLYTRTADGNWQQSFRLDTQTSIDMVYWAKGGRFLVIHNPNDDNLVTLTAYDVRGTIFASRTVAPFRYAHGVLSPDAHWFGYYIPLGGAKGDRGVGVIDLTTKTGGIYTSTQVNGTWDLLIEENSLVDFSPNRHADDESEYYAYISDKDGTMRPYLGTTRSLAARGFGGEEAISLEGPKGSALGPLAAVADMIFIDRDTMAFTARTSKDAYTWNLYVYNISSHTMTLVASNISYADPLRLTANGSVVFVSRTLNSTIPMVRLVDGRIVSFTGLPVPRQAPTLHRTAVSFTITDTTAPTANATRLLSGVVVEKDSDAAGALSSKPLIVWLHGGPYRQTSRDYHPYKGYAQYDWMIDELARSGATVLKLDYIGSYGYGTDYARDISDGVGTRDVQGVLEAVRQFTKTHGGFTRTVLMGNSYGGYLSLRTIVDSPAEVSAAISINGVTEWRTLLSYLHTSVFNGHFGGTWNDDTKPAFDTASISQRIHRLTTKNSILLVEGTADGTINPDQSVTLHEWLTMLGKKSTLVRIPGEDHVFKKAASVEKLCTETFSFLKLTVPAGGCVWYR
jgi:pimeloyl-ACP methyl ester carboxylesterase